MADPAATFESHRPENVSTERRAFRASRDEHRRLLLAFVRATRSGDREANGQPAVLAFQDGRAVTAFLLSAAGGRVRRFFLQVDPERLRRIAPPA